METVLKKERLLRGWSRAEMEVKFSIPEPTLRHWEDGTAFPGLQSRELLCRIFGKSAKELGLDKDDRMGVGTTVVTSNQEEDPMSEIVRRAMFSHLGSFFSGLVDRWPKTDYRYEELQGEISRAIHQQNTVVDRRAAITSAIKGVALVPMQLTAGIALVTPDMSRKTDTDTLLKHLAAGIAACWYLRRGKELGFTSALVSEYIKILTPFSYVRSEAHRKASTGLLAQSFMLKSHLTNSMEDNRQAIADAEQAIEHGLLSGNTDLQAEIYREMALLYWTQGTTGYTQALPHAEKAHALTTKTTPKFIRSFTASALSLCQAANGQDPNAILAEALDLFDPSHPMPSMPYSESILTFVAAAVKQHGGHWSESVKLYEKNLRLPDISALGAIQGRINYAKTEVSRDDRDRDMGLCVKLLSEAIPAAVELGSRRYIAEARECHTLLRVAWPREQAVKQLSELF